MSYSNTEKYIAHFLAKFPVLKQGIKRIYSIANFQLYKKSYNFKTAYLTTTFLSDYKNESFFGYYDKSPLSPNGKFIIFHETSGIFTHKSPDPKNPVKIGLYDIVENSYKVIAETSSYNWQQGSKLQWLNDNQFIFNCHEGGKYISKIYDISSDTFKQVDAPVYDCFKDEFALSLNFSRLNEFDNHYGYKNIPSCNLSELKNDGIFFLDLKSGKSRLLISIEQVIKLHCKETMTNAKHCFNHIMISPGGKHFIFIHRWYQSGKRYDSLILSNIEGTEIKILADNGMVSHCCWYGNEEMIGYLQHPSNGRTFYRIDIKTGKTELLSEKLVKFGDGHPSFHENKMLFDSYPDRSRMQHLYIYNMDKNEVEEIGSFLSPLKFFGETRCDLHPKWSTDGKSVFFDSVHEGKRVLLSQIILFKEQGHCKRQQ